MQLAFDQIKNRFKWDSTKSVSISQDIEKSYKRKRGNSADINLNLIALFAKLNFNVFPVVLNTVDERSIDLNYPNKFAFNHLIVLVEIKNKSYLMDASDNMSDIDILPKYCLSGIGKIIKNNGENWINLLNRNKYKVHSISKLIINNDLSISEKRTIKYKDYAWYDFEKKYFNDEDISKTLRNQFVNQKIDSINIDKKKKNTICLTYQSYESDYIDSTYQKFTFCPVFSPIIKENIFKSTERHYPIEFNYFNEIKQIYEIIIPDEYIVIDLPKPLRVKSSDASMVYNYRLNKVGKKIYLTTEFFINKTDFGKEEYNSLKELYNLILNKQKEIITMQKI
jgi:hypothetical protein